MPIYSSRPITMILPFDVLILVPFMPSQDVRPIATVKLAASQTEGNCFHGLHLHYNFIHGFANFLGREIEMSVQNECTNTTFPRISGKGYLVSSLEPFYAFVFLSVSLMGKGRKSLSARSIFLSMNSYVQQHYGGQKDTSDINNRVSVFLLTPLAHVYLPPSRRHSKAPSVRRQRKIPP